MLSSFSRLSFPMLIVLVKFNVFLGLLVAIYNAIL
jgi:hypothetical protein